MKRLALAIGFLLSAAVAFGEQIAVSQFKYLNNNDNSITLEPTQAQDLLNVDIKPGGRSVIKREGYGLYKDLGLVGAVHGGHHFFDSSGNDVQVWGSSDSLVGIVADATPAVLVSSGTTGATWDCSDTQGFAYCVNSSRDVYVKTNGQTINWYTSPLGTMVEITPTRAVVSGVSGNANTLYFSESANFINFTTGIQETSPFTEVIASPGSKITHIRYGCGKLLWWKDQSFGYLTGENQFDLENTIVSDTVGTFDNTSAIDPGGNVWFRGQDGHIWRYDCTALTKESIDITPNIQTSGKRTSNYWTQTTRSDFGAGYGVNVDTNTTDGFLNLISTSSQFDSLAGWNTSASTCAWSASSGFANSATSQISPKCAISTVNNIEQPSSQNFILRLAFKITNYTGGSSQAIAIFQNSSGNGYCMRIGAGPGTPSGSGTASNNVCGGSNYGTGLITDSNIHYADLIYSATGFARFYVDGVEKGSYNDTTYSGMNKLTISGQCGVTNCATDKFNIDYIYLSVSTGTYYSAIKNANNLTAWDTFSANQTLNDGTLAYYTRASTGSFTVLSSTPGWEAQSNGGLVAASTGTYMQLRIDFGVTAATQTPTVNDFTFNWYEGSASDQSYAIFFDNAIWFTVAYGVGVSTNNYIFKYDLINQGWTLYDFGTSGFAVQNNKLYFGEVAGDQTFRFGETNSDNGNAITAFWKSKDYPGTDPFLQNAYEKSDTLWAQNTNQTATVTYTLDTSSSTAYTVNLTSSTNTIINHRKLLNSNLGYTANFKFGDSSVTSRWELMGYRFTYTPQPYRASR